MSEGIENRSVRRARKKDKGDIWLLRELQRYCYSLPVLEFCFCGVAPHTSTKKNYNLPVYFESGFTPKTLYSPALPTTFIIDKKGNIVIAETGSADWNSESVHILLDGLLK